MKNLSAYVNSKYFSYVEVLFNIKAILYLFRATGGELFRVIAIDPLPEEKAREVVYQIVDGVQHLHALNIVHLDLKVRGWEGEGMEDNSDLYLLMQCCGEWVREVKVSCVYMLGREGRQFDSSCHPMKCAIQETDT